MSVKRYKAIADNTITNAFKSNLVTRGTGSNMGLADSLEVFHIYAQEASASHEISRIIAKFPVVTSDDVTTIQSDRASGAIPASGSNTQIQFNDGGDLAGDADFTFDKADNTLTVTNLDVTGTFSHIEDYGLVTQSVSTTVDYGVITTDDRQPTPHDSYTVSEAGSITGMSPGDMIFVSDETGGATMAFYDGSNWRRTQDRAVIS